MKNTIHSELIQIWRNASDLVSPVSSTNSDANQPPQYPKVDWRTVNKRFLQNIPAPTPQPILGCSSDPSFYQSVHESNDYGYRRNLGSKFTKPNPFGAISGYLTDLGVIAIPEEVFHGHVYQDGVGFVLHAEFEEKKSPVKEKMQRKKKRRQRG